MNAEIIVVNTTGSISQFLTHELAAYGISMTHLTAADCVRLRESLRVALSRNDLVVVAGGLDIRDGCAMREAIADVLGAPPELHEESWERIQEYYRNTGREMPADAQKLAMLPRGCTVFPNDHGCVPGCAISRYGQQVLLLPDVHSELLPMFSDYVAPYLSIMTDGTIVSRTVGVFGLSEAVLNERLADLMSEANPGVVSYARDGEAILRITARAADRRAALALCDPAISEIRQRLGVNVYGVDVGSLQKAVVALLLDKNMKIATAESCTAGLLSSRLTEVAGVSAVFECGIAAYSPEVKHSVLGVPNETIDRFGTVSPEVAGAMATGARRVGNAALGVGITGVAGPDQSEGKPVGTVYIALADEKRVWVKKISIDSVSGRPDRESIRTLATSHALDLVRRYLEAMPTVMAGGEIIQPVEPAVPVIPHSSVSGEYKNGNGLLPKILPWKGDTRADMIRKIALIASFLILLGALMSFVYLRILRPLENERLFRNLADLYDVSDPVIPIDTNLDYPDGMLMQFYALYARNSDVRGWVKIDNTNINYPVMRYNGGFYGNHNFNKQVSLYGVPYFSGSSALMSPQPVNRSMVIYGNNTYDGQMFSDLTEYYNNLTFLKAHPIIEMSTLYKSGKWMIFSVMVAAEPNGSKSRFDYTRSVFNNENEFLDFVGELQTRSLYHLPSGKINVQEGDSLLLLSTSFENTANFGGARLVIAARQLRPGESETIDLSGAAYNKSAIMPSEWPGGSRSKTATTKESTTETLSTSAAYASKTSSKSHDSTDLTTVSKTATTRTTTTEDEPEGPTDKSTENTGSSPATTTDSTATATTSAPTQPTSPATTPRVLAGWIAESDFLSNCRVLNGDELIQPKNKEELQMLLARVVKKELGSSSTFTNDMAAQKAQAIASYSYILYKKLYTITLPDIDLSNSTDKKIYDAVGEVAGIKLLVGDKPACAVYSASTPGNTSNNHEVYRSGSNLPYLQSVVSAFETLPYMPASAKWKTTFTVSMDNLKGKLEAYLKTAIAFEPGRAPFYVRNYDKNGQYVLQTNAYYVKDGKKYYVLGNELRLAVGSKSLRSHAFTVTSSTNDSLTLSVTGYGHGIGLSQWGAVNYAKYQGWDYKQILSHYYSITESTDHRLVAPAWSLLSDIQNTEDALS